MVAAARECERPPSYLGQVAKVANVVAQLADGASVGVPGGPRDGLVRLAQLGLLLQARAAREWLEVAVRIPVPKQCEINTPKAFSRFPRINQFRGQFTSFAEREGGKKRERGECERHTAYMSFSLQNLVPA